MDIENHSKKAIEFSISKVTEQFKRIGLNHQINDRVQLQKYKVYEFSTFGAGALDVELIDCLGKVQLFHTDNREDAMNLKFDESDIAIPYGFS